MIFHLRCVPLGVEQHEMAADDAFDPDGKGQVSVADTYTSQAIPGSEPGQVSLHPCPASTAPVNTATALKRLTSAATHYPARLDIRDLMPESIV